MVRVSRLQPLGSALPSARLLHLPLKAVVAVVAAVAVEVAVAVEAARAGDVDLATMQPRSALRKLFSILDDCDSLGALEMFVLASASECTPKHMNSVHHLLPLSGGPIALTQRWLDDLPAVAVFEL